FAKSVAVAVSIRKKQVARMRIEAFSGNSKDLKAEAKQIEETARQKLQACLGIPVKHVRVHLLPATKVKAKTARVI
ncbi:MAG: alkaline shock response membrane anchor protein AmaP, partial [Lactobacillaceae bacterium]